MMEKKYLYIEGTSGISGDMFVGAMIDLGADLDVLGRALDSIPDEGFGVDVARIQKSGIDCVDFDVYLEEDLENFDDDMAYLYGTEEEAAAAVEAFHRACEEAEEWDEDCGCGCCHHKDETECQCHHHEGEEEGACHCHHDDEDETECHGHHHEHDEEHDHGHCHEHGEEEGHCHCHHHEDGAPCHGHGEDAHHHGEDGHHHHHAHRNLASVSAIIDAADMTPHAKELAQRMFRIVAEAEAKAHRLPIDEVHFHEVGAIDSVVDIISAAVCFDNLGITDVIVPVLCEGRGTVRCQHGVLPVPVPATANIAEAYGLNLQFMDVSGEFVTPTGAAIAAALRTSDALPARFTVEKIGCGAGKRAYTERPGFLRAMLIAPTEADEDILQLTTDIDDSTGEVLGYAAECLLAAGARDVHFAPIFMKKGRPAWELSVLCDREKKEELEEIIFKETTTIGIREMPVSRTVLPRKEMSVATPYGDVEVKGVIRGGVFCGYPEYESVRLRAKETGAAFQEVYDAAKNKAELRMEGCD